MGEVKKKDLVLFLVLLSIILILITLIFATNHAIKQAELLKECLIEQKEYLVEERKSIILINNYRQELYTCKMFGCIDLEHSAEEIMQLLP